MRSTYVVFGAFLFSGLACTGPSEPGSATSCSSLALNGGASRPVCYQLRNGLAVFEGDIVLGKTALLAQPGLRTSREALILNDASIQTATWPNGVVPYTIDANLPFPERVSSGARHYRYHTGIRFIPRTDETDYVTFQPAASGCQSYVGKAGGRQFVSLDKSCSKATVIHEMGHVLGLWHEQSRGDRDQNVIIHWENVQPGTEIQFNQYTDLTQDYGDYDFQSIMHYPPFSFSKNGQPTITRLDGTTEGLGPGSGLSSQDIDALSYLYSW